MKQGLFKVGLGVLVVALMVNFVGPCEARMKFKRKHTTGKPMQTLSSQPQGVKGYVLMLSGNQMPSIGPDNTRSGPKPVQTKVWIFSGRIANPGSPRWAIEKASKHPNLVGSTLSNSNGYFEMKLKPGEYTVLAEHGSYLYLNSFSDDGSYSTVEVKTTQMTEIQLMNTENAAF